MPTFCMRDDGWPKKRCYVKKPPKYKHPHCRHWFKGIEASGCGQNMWQKKGKDGSCQCLLSSGNLSELKK